jgi:hypothetical protein
MSLLREALTLAAGRRYRAALASHRPYGVADLTLWCGRCSARWPCGEYQRISGTFEVVSRGRPRWRGAARGKRRSVPAQLPQPVLIEAEGVTDLVAEDLADAVGDLLPRAAYVQDRDPVQLDPVG